MASYTGHGHHIPGEPMLNPPRRRKLCGGPDFCLDCFNDVMRVMDGRTMLFSNPAGVTPKKVSSLMSEAPTSAPVPSDNVFNKAVNVLHELGHSAAHAEDIVVKLLKSGIVLRDVSEVDKVVDEAAPVLEAVEPTLAPEVESVKADADKVTADAPKISADAQAFIDEVDPPKDVPLSDVGPR